MAQISREIDAIVKTRISNISQTLGLNPEEQKVLTEELTRVPNRTYLWPISPLKPYRMPFFLHPQK